MAGGIQNLIETLGSIWRDCDQKPRLANRALLNLGQIAAILKAHWVRFILVRPFSLFIFRPLQSGKSIDFERAILCEMCKIWHRSS